MVLAHQTGALQQLTVARIGVDAGQFHHTLTAFLQGAHYGVVQAHLFDGVLAVNQ